MPEFDTHEHVERSIARVVLPGVAHPSAKQRTNAHAAVRRVLDALAPEKAAPRGAVPRTAVQRHRSPRGCILQGNGGAVSVSWFAATATDAGFGELRVIAWEGVVSRPGAAQSAIGGARPTSEVALVLVESAANTMVWQTADGATLDDGALVSQCLHMLECAAAEPVADT